MAAADEGGQALACTQWGYLWFCGTITVATKNKTKNNFILIYHSTIHGEIKVELFRVFQILFAHYNGKRFLIPIKISACSNVSHDISLSGKHGCFLILLSIFNYEQLF